jgi:hypothetical protein
MRVAAILLAICASVALAAAPTVQMTTSNMSLWAIARDASAAQMAAFALHCLWIAFLMFVVRPPCVRDAGVSYAERLLGVAPPLRHSPSRRAEHRKAAARAHLEKLVQSTYMYCWR